MLNPMLTMLSHNPNHIAAGDPEKCSAARRAALNGAVVIPHRIIMMITNTQVGVLPAGTCQPKIAPVLNSETIDSVHVQKINTDTTLKIGTSDPATTRAP